MKIAFTMIKFSGALSLAGLALSMSACSLVAPPYPPSLDNVQTLKTAAVSPTKAGSFESVSGSKNPYPIPLRVDSMRSPVGNSFGDYLANALTQELTMAGKLSPQSDVEVKGTLLENDVSVGIAKGNATVSARFVVNRSGTTRYDQVKTARVEWDSAFAAMIAIPNAVSAYPTVFQKLLGELYADPAFITAIQ